MREKWMGPGWRPALAWGIGVALLHRLILGAWLALMWVTTNQWLHGSVNFHDPNGYLPALSTPAEQLIFGVWRRWDAVHYLYLATHGYQVSFPGPTVFGVLTPFGFRLFDALLPGGLDLGAMVFETLAFAAALTLLYRVCETYYGDVELAPWSVVVLAFSPMSFLFASPMSESIYLAFTLGVFTFGSRDRWPAAALCGLMATVARSQGALLIIVAAALLLERQPPLQWRDRLLDGLRHGWTLLLIPLGAVAFTVYRQTLGLPPVDQIYATYSYVFFVNPVEGLWINLRTLVVNLPRSLLNLDNIALLVSPLLNVAMLRFKEHRRLTAVVYVIVSLLVFISKINWEYGTHIVASTQSLARYTVVLFPFAILVADGLRRAKPWGRLAGIGLLAAGLLALSVMNLLALTGP